MAFSTARLNAAVDAALSTSTHVQLHTGDPGGSGTSNVASGVSRAALSGVGSASGGIDVITASWTIPGAGGPFTHFSLWTASTSGTWNGNGTLDPDETFAGAGTLNFSCSVTGT